MKFLTSFDLKIIALITMIIDHFGYVFYPEILWFRIIGRMAFVLYAFMLVEGCFYTSDISKYIKKLTFWAILSEIPYDLVVNRQWFSLNSQNIFFTLLIGVLGITLFKKNNVLFNGLVAFLGMLLGYFLRVDYSWYGIGLIYCFYFFRNILFLKLPLVQGLSYIYGLNVLSVQFFAFLGLIPIIFYNGKLGKKIGNIYYAFYAVHLLLFYTFLNFQ